MDKIGIVLPATPAYSETFFRSKIKGLQASGFEVRLFAGREDSHFDLCPVHIAPPVHRFRPVQALLMALRLAVLLLQAPRRAARFYRLERQSGRSTREALENLYLNSHILPHRLNWLHFGFATMALRRENTARAMGAKMAVSLRGYDIAIYPLKHTGCYYLLWKRVDKVHTISDALVRRAWEYGLPKQMTVVKIPPAIDLNIFSNTHLSNGFHSPLQLLTVARLKWVKGLEYTLEALALLKKEGIAFQYTLIGAGEEYERLAFAAHQLGIREQVTFAGKVPYDQIKSYYEQADIYLQYSISEGFCNAVLEAQAMGLLCIVSDAEGLPENVLHGNTGWVVPKRKPELLAQCIREVLHTGAERLSEIRQAAQRRVREEFNLEKQRREFADFYAAG